MKNGYASPSSSPPTPPSPLPVSVGPGYEKYFFSSSPSPSPPFSPLPSSHTSAENLPLLQDKLLAFPEARLPSPFSLDRPNPTADQSNSKRWCIQDLFEWIVLRCCSSCSWSL